MGMKEKEKSNTTREVKETVSEIVKSMKEEFRQKQKENIQSMSIEFDRQKREIDKEWERRMELQKRSDKAWDKRIKEQHKFTMITVNKLQDNSQKWWKTPNEQIQDNNKKHDRGGRGKMEEQGEREEMSIEEGRTRLRLRVAVTQEAFEALEIKQKKEKKKRSGNQKTEDTDIQKPNIKDHAQPKIQ